jgi:hypothetical protein
MEARNPLSPGYPDFDTEEMAPPARRDSGIRPTAPTCTDSSDDRSSGARLTEDCPTLPPPATPSQADIVVLRIRLVPSIDEILYRLSLGDQRGAFEVAADLGPLVPRVTAPRVVLAAAQLRHVEEHVLSFVDGASTWDEIMSSSPFAPADTLEALCELVDKGIITP